MRDALGSPVVIENRPGAGGQIAARFLKSAAPDGRTVLATASAPITLAAFQRLDYDPATDFAPVSLAVNFQLALVAGASCPARTLADYVAWVRESATHAAYGTAATGSLPHLLGTLIGRTTAIDMLHVPYNGGAPLLTALAGGQLPAGIMLLSEAWPQHRAGKVHILATSGANRAPLTPEIPTFSELGIDVVASGWIAFYAPAATTRPVVDRLSAAIAVALRSPEVARQLTDLGYEPVGSTPEALARRMSDDMQKWGAVARSVGIGDK
jgi:tripartite-type tricarboxylate transporter receptor subunit TctC